MQVDKLNELIQSLITYLNENAGSSSWTEYFLPLFSTVLGAIIALIPVFLTIRSDKNDRKASEIKRQLHDFYNPLLFLLRKDTAFYNIFNLQAKKTAADNNMEYRTLVFLVTGQHNSKKFSETDKFLLQEILSINEQIVQLISKNMGNIDEDISQSLVELCRHYELLRLAEQGKIADSSEYKQYVYPRDIDAKVERKVEELYKKLNALKY